MRERKSRLGEILVAPIDCCDNRAAVKFGHALSASSRVSMIKRMVTSGRGLARQNGRSASIPNRSRIAPAATESPHGIARSPLPARRLSSD